MKNHISKLESGKTYSLGQIFSKEFCIAIPDLQRDYCWGLETYDRKGKQQGELVSGFLASLKDNWQERSASEEFTPMGLIYGYEWPKGTYQLCDGQQRITTFFLLAGELYKSPLVSDEAKSYLYDILVKDKDGSVSGLLYSIRETTLYFLSDLVTNYFLQDSCELDFYNLKERDEHHSVLKPDGRPAWYFLEYDNDPTIQSILGAIYTIRKFLRNSFGEDEQNISSFAKAVANHFTFIYYDMGNRMRGEETFVVLNTTGEPLTSTENLKPLLIGGVHGKEENDEYIKAISKEWEDREDWFWKHKTDKELTSDGLSLDFYTWWLLTYGEKESVNLMKDYLSLDLCDTIRDLHSFFQSLVSVLEWIYRSDDAKAILSKTSTWTRETIDPSSKRSILIWLRVASHREILLPLLAFHKKFGGHHLLNLLRRLSKNYYIGKTTEGKDDPDNLRPYVKLRDIINLITVSQTCSEVLESPSWHNHDELQKELVFNGNLKALLETELDDNLRFDLNVLWETGVDTIDGTRHVRTRLAALHKLGKGQILENIDERIAISMSNKYRLLRFLKRWGYPNGKQENVSWKQWGTWFSRDDYYYNLTRAYNDADLHSLLRSDDLMNSLSLITKETAVSQQKVEGIFSEQSLSKPEGIMRAWLISKLLVNEKPGHACELISPYCEYSLCVNKENLNENKINKNLPMTIGNICLHHCKKTGPWTVPLSCYEKSTCLDSPLFPGSYEVSHKDFEAGTVSEEIINQTTAHILDLFNKYTAEE